MRACGALDGTLLAQHNRTHAKRRRRADGLSGCRPHRSCRLYVMRGAGLALAAAAAAAGLSFWYGSLDKYLLPDVPNGVGACAHRDLGQQIHLRRNEVLLLFQSSQGGLRLSCSCRTAAAGRRERAQPIQMRWRLMYSGGRNQSARCTQ